METIKISAPRQPVSFDPQKWICCMDCGLLIEPWETGKKKWTICSLCSEVYTKTEHPWLSKMLAQHLSELMRDEKRLKHKKYIAHLCEKCGSYFISFERNKQPPKMCHWCTLMYKRTTTMQTSRCIVCHRTMTTPQNRRKLICKDCIPALENIKKALHYTYFIISQTKIIETKIKNYSKRAK